MEMGTILGTWHLGQLYTVSILTLLIPLYLSVHGNLDQIDCSYIFCASFPRIKI